MFSARLEKIPLEVQKAYNIGNKVDIQVFDDVGGSRFEFTNKDGELVSVDAVELYSTGIEIVVPK